ncbi:ornithine cyclodeaminase family protein [Oceaniglobus ichthyenteri]|uniref:ornithine cyclodeaminase family protein n=1 Tax=Oceaniglobus ichthyenteri TaxID=2136177 RepID=UPI000D34C967|nr:ornithine cyclodeaminase [Oceaniglobus ichthyenteri]
MTFTTISFDQGEQALDWLALTDALAAGHTLPRADIKDSFLYRGKDTVLSRAAWIDGLGIAVKTATIFPGRDPMVNGGVNLYSDDDGTLTALIDFHLVTKWKTAGDSLLAARHLARPDSETILILGAGNQARATRAAYGALFPNARFLVWNRSPANARAMENDITTATSDLAGAVAKADIIIATTMTTEPILRGEWLRPGQHIDLIGAYRPDMREADDIALTRASLFVDSRDTTLDHIGELKIPLDNGTISRDAIRADFYDLASGSFARSDADEITLFKNGGGAHLDLMTAVHILNAVNNEI